MKDTIQLNVSAQALFDVMKRSLVLETGEKHPKLAPGYRWSKKTGNRRTRVKLTDWKEPSAYAAHFSTDGKGLDVRYDLEPLGPDRVQVTYTHTLEGSGFLIRRQEKAAVKKALELLRNVETVLLAQAAQAAQQKTSGNQE